MTLLTVPPDTLAGLSADATALAADAWRTKAIAKLSVPIGILSGLIAGAFYNRYATIRLPEYLAFFGGRRFRSEEHTSELQSLMRISYAVFCLKKKNKT